MTFIASFPDPPEMSLKAQLAWEYLFGASCGGWAVANTEDGCWIVADERCALESANIYPDDDSFICWLEAVTQQHLEDDHIRFLGCFCSIKELISDEVARAMEQLL